MKKLLLAIAICVTSLATTGCLQEYYDKLGDLESRTASLQSACDKLNQDVISLQAIVRAIESNDLITGMSQITENGKTVGYKINFAKSKSISIYDGVNGVAPIVGSKKDGDTYYWTIRYGDEPERYMLDSNDNRIPSVGKVPKFRVVDGMWQMSYDTVEWVVIGKASGEQGDSMFKSIDASGKDYVLIYMADGSVFKIPTYSTYSAARMDILTANDNAALLCYAIDSVKAPFVYVADCSPAVDASGNAVGTYVRLSNGKQFTVRDWVGTNVPNIFAKQDTSDKQYYWAVQYGDEDSQWVLDSQGAKVLAISSKVEAPAIGMELAEDGYYYWKITYSADSTVWLGREESVHAVDSVRNSIFKSVKDNPDNLELEMLEGGAIYKLPKQFYVALSATDTTHSFSGDTLSMRELAAKDTAYVSYRAFGAAVNDISFISQGGFSAKAAGDSIMVVAPAQFSSDQGKVMAIFNLDGYGSAKTVIKTIYIKKEEE